jgi:hypothetical protein
MAKLNTEVIEQKTEVKKEIGYIETDERADH